MTRAKLEALRLLAIRPRLTWKWTTDEHIGGRVAKQLEREGLAIGGIATVVATLDRVILQYQITDAGRAALAKESIP
jgi:hypothetical protein